MVLLQTGFKNTVAFNMEFHFPVILCGICDDDLDVVSQETTAQELGWEAPRQVNENCKLL